ncbi:transketolase [Desulfomicrobium norvegicum]|uniref:Transketolase n=1 Tax=Desulfomicrobium norvegicum (strain DSM 1741 / NCIMB 8310) TaxID=52561 RepID=A0A8G2C225_DESNO|nr:transketolase [Desulfomicrobium norvegicum]SFL60951.1 transketolase [Desulfomicrobium norvegicum]
MTTNASQIDTKAVNVIKGLIMDTVRASNSGHPGGAMSSADFAYVLFKEFLNFDPKDAKWFNRDRFVLSAGHESALLYAILTLQGSLSVDDLKAFRQFGSKTPGHPEHDMTDGVEATTGPLGQGFAMAGGMAVAEAFLRDYLDAQSAGHFTYALVSDGDVQEPICLGSAALFGHWGLGRLIAYYDSNKIQLAGPTCRADKIDHKALFESMHWQVIEIDGHDHEQIRKAILEGQAETAKPTLIIGHTTMAKGCATLEGSESTHGSPLPEAEITATKAKLGLPDESFYLPEDVLSHFRARFASLGAARNDWDKLITARLSDADFAARWENATTPVCQRSLNWPEFESGSSVATRKAFGACLGAMMEQLPTLMGGSADLDPSNQTVKFREFAGIFNAASNAKGRNLCFGVREFPMGAILNGMSLHGGIVPFGATFLVFSDYERNAIRMSALQHLPVLHVFTHDSFFVGEDGPTHQPIEHVSSLRLIPNLLVLRPADARESAACMAVALKQKSRPSVLIFTRQGLPVLDLPNPLEEHVSKGAYVVRDPEDAAPQMLILASGSEVHLALEAAEACPELKIRVVSVPSMELFDEQSAQYRESVMPRSITRRVAIEAGRSDLWYKYVGLDGKVWGINHFGASAPAGVLKEKYGFTTANLIKFIKE